MGCILTSHVHALYFNLFQLFERYYVDHFRHTREAYLDLVETTRKIMPGQQYIHTQTVHFCV